MEKYLKLIKPEGLFQDFDNNELSIMLKCLSPSLAVYSKDQNISLQDKKASQVGIIIDGKAKIRKEDINGNAAILDELGFGDILGENFISAKILKMPVSIWAITQTTVIFFDHDRIMSTCPVDCAFHRRLIRNIVETMSAKIISLNQKIYILQNNTIRGKLVAFFEMQREKANSNSFTISFNRNELAEYIGVNRSAMSRELYNMLHEGVIEFDGNNFRILY